MDHAFSCYNSHHLCTWYTAPSLRSPIHGLIAESPIVPADVQLSPELVDEILDSADNSMGRGPGPG
jgi:hypothetical protein